MGDILNSWSTTAGADAIILSSGAPKEFENIKSLAS